MGLLPCGWGGVAARDRMWILGGAAVLAAMMMVLLLLLRGRSRDDPGGLLGVCPDEGSMHPSQHCDPTCHSGVMQLF